MATENRTSSDGVALIIERSDAGEISDLAEYSVESVGLFPSLGWGTTSGSPSLSAGRTSCGICSALVHELVTDELPDDVEVLSGTVVVAHCIPRQIVSAQSPYEGRNR